MRDIRAASLMALAVSLGTAMPAAAQESPAPAHTPAPEQAPGAESSAGSDRIVVTGERQRGTVDTPHPPVAELNEADVAAYGAGSIAELIEALSSQTGGGSGRGGAPIMLVNGRRISNFLEIASFPPEAIERVQILAAETAQEFGYSPDQRLVNIILKENYSSRELQGLYGQPADGGFSRKQTDATYLRIDGESRLNFNASWNDITPMSEADRGVIQTPGSVPTLAGDPDPALYRTLIADSAGWQGDANFATQLSPKFSLSLTGSVRRNDSLRLQGLDSVLLTAPDGASALRTLGETDPLTIDTRSTNYTVGTTLDAWLGDWQITGTASGNRSVTRSTIARRADTAALQAAALAGTLAIDADLGTLPEAGFDSAESVTDTANTLVTAVGRPVRLPGGPVAVTLDTGFNWTGIDSRDTRGTGAPVTLTRGDLSAGINLGIPLTNRTEDFGGEVGDFTLNLQAGLDRLSDFGTLNDVSLGLAWGVTDRLSLNVTRIWRDAAPSLAQLGNPETETVNVPVFDFTRGETVLATVTGGGNPFLPAQSQRDWRFSLNWQLPDVTPAIQQGRLNIEFFRNHSEDVASGFPVLTPTIEAAFPDRVTRDAAGRLQSIDQRPVAFARQDSKRLQVGLFFTGPLGKARPQAASPPPQPQSQPPQTAPDTTRRTFTFGGSPGAQGQGGPGAGRPFDPAAFQQLRARICAPEAADKVPTAEELAGLPEPMLAQVRNGDGTIDAERWARFRGPFCSAQTNMTTLDPQRMARLREQYCPKPGEPARPIPDEELDVLPPELLERFKDADGKIDRERLDQLVTQFCNAPAPPPGGQQPQGGQQGAPVIMIISGPPPGGAPGGGGAGPAGPPPGAMGGGGGFIGGGSPDGRGRWFANVNYSYEIANEVLVAEGGPLLDLLDGDALSGSLPRHSGNFNLGLFYRGFGMNVNARYVGSSRINGSGLPGSTDLIFDDIATFNLRFFADLGQRKDLVEKVPLLANTRVTLGANNLFDARQRIVDDTGAVPLRYQPYLVDPVGRFLTLEIRKLF